MAEKAGTVRIDAQQLTGGIAPSLRIGLPQQYSPQSRGIDIFRSLGGMTASFYATPIGGSTITDLISWLVPGQGTASGDFQYAYGYGTTGRIYRIGQTDSTVSLIRTVAAFAGTPDGLEPYGQSGTFYLFYSYATDIGRSGADWSSAAGYTDTYWTGTLGQAALSAANPHPLKKFLTSIYVADGNVVHEINGTTVTLNKIVLPKGQVIVQFEATATEFVMLTRTVANGNFVGNAKEYFWDGFQTRYTHVTDLGESYAPCMLNVSGRIMNLMGSNVRYLADCTSDVQKIATVPVATLPSPGGLATRNGTLYALCAGSDNRPRVISYGSPYPEIEKAIHNPYIGTLGTSALQTGALMVVDKNNIIGAWYDGASYQLLRWSNNFAPNCQLVTMSFNGGTTRKKDWDQFKFYFSQLIADESLKFYYAIDGGDLTVFSATNPSYSGFTTWASLTGVLWSAETAVKWSDLGQAIAFWQIETNIHAHELQLAIEFVPSSDYQRCPVFYSLEARFQEIRE